MYVAVPEGQAVEVVADGGDAEVVMAVEGVGAGEQGGAAQEGECGGGGGEGERRA